jgi:hypothetical protein
MMGDVGDHGEDLRRRATDVDAGLDPDLHARMLCARTTHNLKAPRIQRPIGV